MANARDCGTVWVTVQRVSSGYVGEFSSYTVSFEQSDRVPGIGRGDSVHQGPSTIGTGDEGWTVHADGGLRYCDTPKPGGPLNTIQPAEYKWRLGYPTLLYKIRQSILCTGSSTQIQNLHILSQTVQYMQYIQVWIKTASWAHATISIKHIPTMNPTISNSSKSSNIYSYTIHTLNLKSSNTCIHHQSHTRLSSKLNLLDEPSPRTLPVPVK